jgi:hypothetical protein
LEAENVKSEEAVKLLTKVYKRTHPRLPLKVQAPADPISKSVTDPTATGEWLKKKLLALAVQVEKPSARLSQRVGGTTGW